MSLAQMLLATVLAATQNPLFKTTTEAVQVDVFVGRNGRAVLGLGAKDFELFDGGLRQEIALVNVQAIPLHIALVLDTSSSVAGVRLLHLKRAAHDFIDAALDDDAEDEAALVTFSHHLDRRARMTPDRDTLHRAVDEAEAYGATAWHDALYTGLKIVEGVKNRPMVLLFTDGEDTYSWLRDEQMAPLVEQSNAVIFAVAMREGPAFELGASSLKRERKQRYMRKEHSKRTRLLRRLTATSGGRFLETTSTETLSALFLEILGEMTTRYILTYRPPDPIHEGWHDLEVKVKVKRADVRARRGYFYEAKR